MKREAASERPDSKTAHERFVALGEQLMRVPRDEVAALEKKWRAKRKRGMKKR
jgi:hypothetical protein